MKGKIGEAKMKNEDGYFELVRQACENVSRYIEQWSKQNNGEIWGEHEATWKALLFHELILSDKDMKDNLSMENKAETDDEDTQGKRFDFWLLDSKNKIYYLIEVKFIHKKNRKSGYGFIKLNSKEGVYGDLLKLGHYFDSNKEHDSKCISIAVNTGKDNVEVGEIIKKVDQKLTSLLNDDLRLLICSSGKCKYVPADES